jgi:ribose/xylose/arabinose/galactoside ABC-type transport system permease subunit
VVELGAIRSLLQLSDFSANALQVVAGGLLLASVTIPQLAAMMRRRRDRLTAIRG